ncbi:MAG: chalcone isomerase family protein [Spirochaetes bacterium]|nr:chalcone isomerase family protein [Spirochaetota bacterium]
MKKLCLFLGTAALLLAFASFDGFAFKLAGKEMVINGSGIRTKAILGSMYKLTLWVPAKLKGADGKKIIEANEPMSMVLVIDSRLITRKRFVEATTDGFGKSAKAGYASAKTSSFLKQFDNVKFSKGDIVIMKYTPAGLITQMTYKETGKTENLGTIAGLDLKKALYAIWLGPNPVQESLKKSLLGGGK